ncbi:DUF2884 family protein [Luteimonas aestuarii]|nr:DUF2884 family protein [Luteimonas aestuarii]
MRPISFAAVACGIALLAVSATSAAGRHGFGSQHSGCSVESAYTLRVGQHGIRLHDNDGKASPQRIDFHDGALRIDGIERDVSQADARRLRSMEAETRALLPEIAGITREAIGITFDTLGSVNAALAGNRRNARQFERLRARSLARIDETLGRGVWNADIFGDAFEAEIEAAAESMAASFTPGRAIWMVMTGGIGRMERRMEKMEGDIERSISAREGQLEQHATGLCTRLETLDALQEAMELRLDDGRPLRVFEFRRGHGVENPGEDVQANRGS